MQEHVERFGNARSGHGIALNNCLVGTATSCDVVTLDGEDLLKHMAGAKGLKCPNLHLTETLTTKLGFTTKWLLSDK